VDLQPWMGQIGIAGASVLLFVILGKSYINHVASQVGTVRDAHEKELARLEAIWEARLADMRERANAWQATANRFEQASAEDRRQVDKLLVITETTEALVRAIKEGQGRP
jgi:hypothetical protein